MRSAVVMTLTVLSATLMLGQSVPELVREHGAISQTLTPSWEPIQFSKLLSCSDLILDIRVLRAKSHLAADEMEIDTDYTFSVLDSMRPREPKLVGSNIFVTRSGGATVIEGARVESIDPQFPQFTEGDEYVVFLKFDKKTGQHNFCGGPQGAYLVRNGKLEPVARFGGAASALKAKSRADLMQLLRAPSVARADGDRN